MKVLQYIPKRFGVFDFHPKLWENGGSKMEIRHFWKLTKFARQTPNFLENRNKNQKYKTPNLLGTYWSTFIPNLKVPSSILIDFYSFESKNSLFSSKTPIFARRHMYLDTKINFENVITLVLVGIFPFSKNWDGQCIIFYLKMK